MDDAQRKRFAEECKGKTIQKAEWVEGEQYWALTFTDDSEVCVRLMVDLFNK